MGEEGGEKRLQTPSSAVCTDPNGSLQLVNKNKNCNLEFFSTQGTYDHCNIDILSSVDTAP